MFVEFDLAGAEWVVVAYLADDPNMLAVVESMKTGRSPHVATGSLISRAPENLVELEHKAVGSATDPDTIKDLRKAVPGLLDGDFFLPRSMSIRQCGKKANHGLNYDMRYKKFALINEMPEPDAARIVDLYHTQAYPGIRANFHGGIKRELKHNDRTLENLLGRKARLLDQPGPDLWDKAYSFKPQSTVADIVLRAMSLAYGDATELMQPMRLKANVHDSILCWYPDEPREQLFDFARRMRAYLSPELTCGDRQFTLGVDVKAGPSWGHMAPLDLGKEVFEQRGS